VIDRSLAAALALVGAVALLIGAWFARDSLSRWFAPDPVTLPLPASPMGADLRRVHAELLPELVLAGAHPDATDAAAVGDAARSGLRAEFAGDAGMTAILEDLLFHMADPVDNAEALFLDVDRWNRRLGALGEPWRIDGGVLVGEPAYFYVKSYQVLADLDADVGGRAVQIRLVQRMDSLNVVERYLGAARTDDGAVVVVDRVAEFAIDALWPLLGDDPQRPAGQAAWRDAIHGELALALPAADLALLEATAPQRARLLATIDQIATRHDCGSSLMVARPPWDGFPAEDVRALWGYAAGSEGRLCPEVMDAEALVIDEASASLRRAEAEGLGPALERLTSFASRAFGAHEARHVADAIAFGEATNVPCAGCSAELGPEVRAELSAYAGALATDGTAMTAAWQACTVADQGGSHGAAVLTLIAALDPELCSHGPDPALPAAVRTYEGRAFSRDERIALPASWPDRLPLP
jgi:hypothetical protein